MTGRAGFYMHNFVLLTGLAGALLAGCVTINIYFPAAAVEKAADKIIDEVWQLKNPGQAAPASPDAPPVK
jgi:hypothetical protein